MKVFYIVDKLERGGTETQLVQVARLLSGAGHDVTVGCLRAKGPLLETLHRAGIAVVEFPPPGTLLSLRAIYQLIRLAQFIHRMRFRVVHTHDLWSTLMGVPAAWLARTPVIISSRRDLAHLSWYTPWRRKALRAIQHLSTVIVANSAAVHDFLVREENFDPDKIRVIRNAVDFARFANACGDRSKLFPGLDPRAKLVAVVANMHSSVKGHAFLIRAARTICTVFPQTRFVLIGDGQQRPKLEQQVKDVGLQENFLFLGRRKDVPELLACCDLSILTSTAEGLPNAVLESLAAGVPVVATRVGGTVEIIEDRVSGLLVPPRDPEALADRTLELLRDARLAQKLARAGQDRVRTYFNFDRLLLELKELYDEPRLKEGAKMEQSQRKEEGRWVRAPDPATMQLKEIELTSAKAAQLHQSGKPRLGDKQGMMAVGESHNARKLRVLLVAPSLRSIGGQAVQAELLLSRWRRDSAVDVRFLPMDPAFPLGLGWVEHIRFLRTLVRTLIYVADLARVVSWADVVHIFLRPIGLFCSGRYRPW